MKTRFYLVLLAGTLIICGSCVEGGNSTTTTEASSPHTANISNSAHNLPDVFIVVVDALRADHVGAYGYHRNTTPFIDTIAEKALVFTRAYASSSFTRESVSALFTGRYPSSTPWSMGWMAQVDPEVKTIAEVFAENGYQTILCTDQPALEPEMFGKGFNIVEYYTDKYETSGNGDKIVESLLKKVSELKEDKPLFVYLHFYDPHAPYEPSASFYLRFSDKIYPAPLRLHDEVRFNLPKLIEQGFGPGEERFEDLVLRYDAEIAMVDESIKKLYESISKLRKDRETLWIFTADHGEEFLEHGFVEHAWRLYFESIHIPLIISHSPYTCKRINIPDEVSLVDLFPSIVTHLNLPFSDHWDGIALPLKEWMKGEKNPLQTNGKSISELNIPTRTVGISLIKDGWQYLCWQKWLTWQECSEYASKQGELREMYFQGKLSAPKFCSQPVYEELISPDENGYPKNFTSPENNKEILIKLKDTMREWCSKRPEMKTDIEKKKITDELKQKRKVPTTNINPSEKSPETKEEEFDPLKHAGYL